MASERTLTAPRPDPTTGPDRWATRRPTVGADLPPDPDGPVRTRWARWVLLAILAVTAAASLYDLSASGYGNSFYAAAVEAGTKSWKAFLFGSLDSSNFITVDKPPASVWVMELSARLFGFGTWSVMAPQVVEGLAAVALLFGAVRRVAGDAAGLVAAAILAVTPVAALMFRFDNPDAFLVLLLVAAAYCMTRAIERAGTRWIVAAGALLGLAFLTKMLQAFTVVPAFGLVYLLAAPTTLRRRLAQLGAGSAALVVAAGWWIAIVSLTPAADRPFVDGSPDNSIINLIFVYNGFGRLTGSSGGAGGGAGFSGNPGVLRLFNDLMGGQASWLLPAALVLLVVTVAARWHAPRTDRVRAAVLLWGGWLLVTGATFSYGRGIIHTYYTVALVPAIAALVAVGAVQLWSLRRRPAARTAAAVTVLGTGTWAWVLLDRTPDWHPALRWAVITAAVLAAAGCLAAPAVRAARTSARRLVAAAVVSLAIVAGLGGPAAYATETVSTGHTGSIPSAGPSASTGRGGLGAGATAGGTAGAARFGGGTLPAGPGGTTPPKGVSDGTRPTGAGAPTGSGRSAPAGRGGRTRGSAMADGGAPPATAGRSGSRPAGFGGGTGGFGGGAGGSTTTSGALVEALEADAARYRWVAATDGSQSAATLELATGGDPVMAIGGFDGEGGNLTLAAFEAYVAEGDIHFYIAGGSGGPGGGSSTAITAWVEAHFTATTIGGETVYDLTTGTSTAS